MSADVLLVCLHTVELQWLEHLQDYENMFETGVVRASREAAGGKIQTSYRFSLT